MILTFLFFELFQNYSKYTELKLNKKKESEMIEKHNNVMTKKNYSALIIGSNFGYHSHFAALKKINILSTHHKSTYRNQTF